MTTSSTKAPATAEAAAEAFRRDVTRLRDEIARVIVSHDEVVEGVVIALLAGGHALLEGVPGLGKTLLVRTLAEAVDLAFSRIQFTPDLMPADILGTNVIVEDERGSKRFEFQRGPIFANIVLADEINRATPKTQSALLEAMQERSVTLARTTHVLATPFFVLATQNPLEMEGTYPLPEAQLDRFFVKLKVGFPSTEALHSILDRTTQPSTLHAEKVLSGPRLVELGELVRQVPVARAVQDFAVRVLEATHPQPSAASLSGSRAESSIDPSKRGTKARAAVHPMVRKYVRYGSSPRGAQALILGGKVRALLAGRYAVSVDDVRAMAKPALRHRLILNFEGQAEGIDSDIILDEVVESVRAATAPKG